MSIVIVNYGLGNIQSVQNMFSYLGFRSEISNDPSIIREASHLILPGVGAFDHGMKLIHNNHLFDILNEKVLIKKTPVLGICLGMQLMCKHSEEGTLPGLGWIDASVIRFRNTSIRVPHMGWNDVHIAKDNKIIQNEESSFYFVHSYHVVLNNSIDTLLTTNYGDEFVSGFQKENIFGVQFHPEKSHRFGMALLTNFIHNL